METGWKIEVRVNGKTHGKIVEAPYNADDFAHEREREFVKEELKGKTVVKCVYVKGRFINFITQVPCEVCGKDYTRVKSWQKYCSKECKVKGFPLINGLHFQRKIDMGFYYGHSDNVVFINDVELTEFTKYSYTHEELILFVSLKESQKIRKLDWREQDIKIMVNRVEEGELKSELLNWVKVSREEIEVTSMKGEPIMAKITYKILKMETSNDEGKKIKGLEKNDEGYWSVDYED